MTPMDLTHLADEPGTVQAARYRSEGWWGRRALADGLEAGATHRPDAVAVADATESLTYRAAAGRVAQTITALRDRGVDAGSRVVLIAGNTGGVSKVNVDGLKLPGGVSASTIETAGGVQYYIIQSGDNLSKIAKQFLGDASKYPVIFEANREVIKDADKIFPGQKIRIPAA